MHILLLECKCWHGTILEERRTDFYNSMANRVHSEQGIEDGSRLWRVPKTKSPKARAPSWAVFREPTSSFTMLKIS